MPFIPHTPQDTEDMLAKIGVSQVSDLFDEIPESLRINGFPQLLPGLSEMEAARLMQTKAEQDPITQCFIGAGAYEHHIPAAVWDITTRGEWMTAYTPYQAEASQGTLQLIWEYQTMMAGLMDMDVSNASLYEGATALAEAVLMAVRLQRKHQAPRVLVPESLHPHYRAVLDTVVGQRQIELVTVAISDGGVTPLVDYQSVASSDISAVIVPQPNFLGALEAADEITDWAHSIGALVIGVVNPMAMALLKPPGQWGTQGADIACGEGQPMGIPLASGGPYFGFMTSKKAHVRQMPGRIVGRTTDMDGKVGYALTLQAREQHIRRAKATSNICTNQGLLVTAATIYMSLMGPEGLKKVALASHQNTLKLKTLIQDTMDVSFYTHQSPFFHELALHLPVPAACVINEMAKQKIDAGFDLESVYPQFKNGLLVCVTETKTESDIKQYVSALARAIAYVAEKKGASCDHI